ncbi:MAG: branched-chain amino acid ABC transporter permease [Gammaproteobacteria bacterium]|jgi:branched-chain amino acid transport system permease protein|nr:branched-chain amino acid ABC transporter permease [Gammaproteobacteria bacterium]
MFDLSINAFFMQLLTGLQMGSIYVLIALGLTLIFGTLGVVNFAHGALYLVAIYLAVSINDAMGFGMALVLVPTILFILGLAMERGLIQFFYNRPHTDQILVTFGLAIVIQELLKWVFGANNIPFAIPSWGNGIILMHEWFPFLEGFVVYPKWRMILVVVSIVTVSAVFALLHWTTFGLVIRAGMRDSEMLQFLGVNINRRFMIVFGLGSLIAGIAGVFGGPVTQVSPEVGMHLLVPSFLVVVIGGMGSLSGAVLAGILIGMAQSFTAYDINLSTIIIYLITVIVLLVRPRGLLGAKGVFE